MVRHAVPVDRTVATRIVPWRRPGGVIASGRTAPNPFAPIDMRVVMVDYARLLHT